MIRKIADSIASHDLNVPSDPQARRFKSISLESCQYHQDEPHTITISFAVES